MNTANRTATATVLAAAVLATAAVLLIVFAEAEKENAMIEKNIVVVGVDVGQRREPTGICVGEIESREESRPAHYLIRHLERLPAGTTYPEIAHRLTEIVEGVRRQGALFGRLYVDATGLGEPVLDVLRQEGRGLGRVTGVYFTHGDQRIRKDHRHIVMGKAYLVTRLQTLLQTGRLHLPETPEARTLAEELQEFEINVPEDANDRYGAFRVGSHDDLVTALGMAAQKPPLIPGPRYLSRSPRQFQDSTDHFAAGYELPISIRR